MVNHGEDSPEDFRMRYGILIDDIRYMKTRQWSVTYYLLLLYAAIISFFNLMGFEKNDGVCIEKNILIIATVLVAVLGSIYQCDFQTRITRYRNLLLAVLKHLSEGLKKFEERALTERFKDSKKYASWWNGFSMFTFPLTAMLWIGVGFVWWYLFL